MAQHIYSDPQKLFLYILISPKSNFTVICNWQWLKVHGVIALGL